MSKRGFIITLRYLPLLGMLLVVLYASILTVGGYTNLPTVPTQVNLNDTTAASVKGTPANLEAHFHGECWNTGEGHPVPTNVIVRAGSGWKIAGNKVTAEALRELFSTKKAIEVYKFCSTLDNHPSIG